jgi:O-antigen/teichoic acid export membrane protein
MQMIPSVLRGDGLLARALRGSAWTVTGYGTSQALRLAANLILTRLLFPEAFGLMALVTVFLTGLMMFSDVGISPAIQQNRRGDDPEFLNTAWTMQVIRGVSLWLIACALAWPVATFYGEPLLAQILPVSGLTLLIAGFNPTRIETANRHLMLGRVTVLELCGQLIAITTMIALAWATRSIWALVAGTIVGAVAHLLLNHFLLPGPANRFRWERSAAGELIRFGKWIFLSTVFGFAASQGDRAILGKYLSMDQLGIYNIGHFLASFPLMLGSVLIGRLLIPLYRERPPAASAENFRKLRRMRLALTGSLMAMVLTLALIGVPLVGVLYDPRYAAAGAIVVLVCVVRIAQIIGQSYSQAALAAGDSRRFFLVVAASTTLQIGLFLIGAEWSGLVGALVGQGLALVLSHPLIVWLARRHGAWDPLHDAGFAAVGLVVAGAALWLHGDAILTLATFGAG